MLPLSVGIFTGLAGCGEEPSRDLNFSGSPEFSETPSGEFVGDISVKYQPGLASKPDWEAFHSVQLRGFSVDRELVCVADYGDIPESQTRKREVQCDRFPSILVLTADESPCESGTKIGYLVYYENYSGRFVWRQEFLGCNEELPPEVEETPVTPTATPVSTGTTTATTSTTTESARNRTDDTPSTSSDG
jgi:hypothetical protein